MARQFFFCPLLKKFAHHCLKQIQICSTLDFSFLFHTSAVQCEFVVLVTSLGDTMLVANLGELCAISENNNLSYR